MWAFAAKLAALVATLYYLSRPVPVPHSAPVPAPAPAPVMQKSPAVLTETAILLPEPDGEKSGIVLQTAGKEIPVTEPYQGVQLVADQVQERQYSAEEVEKLYPDVMHALPERPRTFILRFETRGVALTEASRPVVDSILQEIARRPVPEITVTGYTDRAGSEKDNFQLSLDRAETVRMILLEYSIAPESIQVVGRGELDPIVETADDVAEPLNRRVEVSVR